LSSMMSKRGSLVCVQPFRHIPLVNLKSDIGGYQVA
jgi:hypothetical protein